MRFIHIADVHLGAEPDAGKAYSKRRTEEIWDSFVQIVSLCGRETNGLLLIAGDLFHRQPLLRELKEVNELFAKLTHTEVVLIAGIMTISEEILIIGLFNGMKTYILCLEKTRSMLS